MREVMVSLRKCWRNELSPGMAIMSSVPPATAKLKSMVGLPMKARVRLPMTGATGRRGLMAMRSGQKMVKWSTCAGHLVSRIGRASRNGRVRLLSHHMRRLAANKSTYGWVEMAP